MHCPGNIHYSYSEICFFFPIISVFPSVFLSFLLQKDLSCFVTSLPKSYLDNRSRYNCRKNSQMQWIYSSHRESRTGWSKWKHKEGLCPKPHAILLKTLIYIYISKQSKLSFLHGRLDIHAPKIRMALNTTLPICVSRENSKENKTFKPILALRTGDNLSTGLHSSFL